MVDEGDASTVDTTVTVESAVFVGASCECSSVTRTVLAAGADWVKVTTTVVAEKCSSVSVRVVVCAGSCVVSVSTTVFVAGSGVLVTVCFTVVAVALGTVPSAPLPSTLTTEYGGGDLLCRESAIGCAEASRVRAQAARATDERMLPFVVVVERSGNGRSAMETLWSRRSFLKLGGL